MCNYSGRRWRGCCGRRYRGVQGLPDLGRGSGLQLATERGTSERTKKSLRRVIERHQGGRRRRGGCQSVAHAMRWVDVCNGLLPGRVE